VRDGQRRLRAGLWAAVAVGVVASVSVRVFFPSHPGTSGLSAGQGMRGAVASGRGGGARSAAAADSATAASILAALKAPGSKGLLLGERGNPVADARAALRRAGQTETTAAQQEGVFLPARGGARGSVVPVAELSGHFSGPRISPLHSLRPADLLVVAPTTLPATAVAAVRRQSGVTAADVLDAARIKVNGSYVAMLGVNAATFREYAAAPTARSTSLWQNVADGGIAVSYLMGQQERLPLGGAVTVTGVRTERLRVGGFGTVGISGVDAVVSDAVARSLGMPAGNAIVVSAPRARLNVLIRELKLVSPRNASVTPLVGQAAEQGLPVTAGSAGAIGITASDGPGLTLAQTRAFLTAAVDQVGKPYVWGGNGPNVYDCSGLVQWSMRQAGVIMPRVAVDQAQTGPLIPVSELQPGDLLFYHTDPTAPSYISHVAIYLGSGLMLQAPEPGLDVEIVPAIVGGPGFAGAVKVYPRVAAVVAAETIS
jgi:peptidoglycan DL-endopeptidase CwlO